MKRIYGLLVAGGMVLGLASSAGAQTAVTIGGPYGGGISVTTSPYASFGYNSVMGGMGYYPSAYGPVAPGVLPGSYSSGYLGYAPSASIYNYSSGYSGYAPGYNMYAPTASPYAAPTYGGYAPTVSPYAAPIYGGYGAGYAPYYGAYGYRRGFLGGMRSGVLIW